VLAFPNYTKIVVSYLGVEEEEEEEKLKKLLLI
jgi:hypothetical protein